MRKGRKLVENKKGAMDKASGWNIAANVVEVTPTRWARTLYVCGLNAASKRQRLEARRASSGKGSGHQAP